MEHTPSSTVAITPRAGLHARRAAAARRRALLTVTLLVLTAATGTLGATTAVSAWFTLAPAVLLVAVLALGRQAVRANARADAAWEAREHARRAAPAASDDVRLAGRPAPAVRPRVTGRAVKPSQSQTQMIARVRPSAVAAASQPDKVVEAPRPVRAADAVTPAPAPAVPDASADRAVDAAAETVTAAKATPEATEWTSVPVPRPVYTLKSAAPRWEPAPLTAEMAQITLARRAELAAGDTAPGVPAEVVSRAVQEPEAPSDSLGVNLNSVLARRRAAGE